MSRYSAVLAGGAVVGQVVGGLLISADLLGSTWRPVFLVNVPVGIVLAVAGARYLPASRGEQARLDRSRLDLVGLVMLACAVFALVLPLVLGQSEHWPVWGWALLGASPVLLVVFALAERRLAAAGGAPIVPGQGPAAAGVRPGDRRGVPDDDHVRRVLLLVRAATAKRSR
jgi:MFS family permease